MSEFKLIDLPTATSVEVILDPSGKVWVNIDGACAVRIGECNVFAADLHDLNMLTHGKKTIANAN